MEVLSMADKQCCVNDWTETCEKKATYRAIAEYSNGKSMTNYFCTKHARELGPRWTLFKLK